MDIWDDSPPKSGKTTESIVKAEVLDASSLTTIQSEKEAELKSQGDGLARVVLLSDVIVKASFDLTNFVPNDLESNPEKIILWKLTLIPQIVQSLRDDVLQRNYLIEGVSRIAQFGIVIKEASQLLIDTKGSERAVAVAQKTIKAYYDNIQDSIVKLESVKSASLVEFSKNIEALISLIGPEAANWVTEKDRLLNQMKDYERELEEFYLKRTKLEAEIVRCTSLINATKERLNLSQEEEKALRDRSSRYENLFNM
jgi:hypothetical protein